MVGEVGRAICALNGTFVSGPLASQGDPNNVKVPLICPPGGRLVGLDHTHPGGGLAPSRQDMAEARRLRLDFMCVTVPETGKTKCKLLQRP